MNKRSRVQSAVLTAANEAKAAQANVVLARLQVKLRHQDQQAANALMRQQQLAKKDERLKQQADALMAKQMVLDDLAKQAATPPPPPLVDAIEAPPPASKKSKVGEHVASPPRCPHCCKATRSADFCEHEDCKLRVDQPFESPQNVYIRAGQRGQSNNTPTPTAPRIELSARDREFERLANIGDPYERFDNSATTTVNDAFDDMLGAFSSADYEVTSTSLRALIQSGKLTLVGDAIPRRTEALGATGAAGSIVLDANGFRTVAAAKSVPVNNLNDFFRALIGSIIPSLIMQPRAVIDWCTMAMTLMELTSQHNWDTASQYLNKTLQRCVDQRKPFGAQVTSILQDILMKKATARPQHPQAAAAAKPLERRSEQQAPAATPRPRSAPVAGQPCGNWNFRICEQGVACIARHSCQYAGFPDFKCASAEDGHQGKDCVHRPSHAGAGYKGKHPHSGGGAQSGARMNVVRADGKSSAPARS